MIFDFRDPQLSSKLVPKTVETALGVVEYIEIGDSPVVVAFEVHAKMFEARVPNVELLAVGGGEHVDIFTHRNMVRIKVIDFMQRHFTA